MATPLELGPFKDSGNIVNNYFKHPLCHQPKISTTGCLGSNCVVERIWLPELLENIISSHLELHLQILECFYSFSVTVAV